MNKVHAVYLCFCLTFCSLAQLNAQISKGVKSLEKKQYEKAQVAFSNDLEKEEEKALANFYLAKLLMQKDFVEGYNLKDAYQYADKAIDLAQSATPGAKKKMSAEKISLMQMRKLRDDIVKASLKEAESNKDVAFYDQILGDFKNLNAAQNERAHKQRNKLAFEIAVENNTSDAWENYWKKYNESLKKYDTALCTSAQKHLFERYMAQHSWNAYGQFAARYPENVYVADSAAAVKMQLAIRKNTVEAYKGMLDAHPSSPFAAIAKDSLAAQVIASRDLAEHDYFVRKYSDYTDIQRLWESLYSIFCKEANNCPTAFYEKYSHAPKGLK